MNPFSLSALIPLALQYIQGRVASMAPVIESAIPFVIQVLPGFLSGAETVVAPSITIHEAGHVYVSDPITFRKQS